MFIFIFISLISTHSCAAGISCTYQIQINSMTASKHSPPQPKERGMFLSSCMSRLKAVPLSTYPNHTTVFPPSEAGKRFRLRSTCWRPVGLSGKTQKLAPKNGVLQRNHLQIPFLLSPVWLCLQTEGKRMQFPKGLLKTFQLCWWSWLEDKCWWRTSWTWVSSVSLQQRRLTRYWAVWARE